MRTSNPSNFSPPDDLADMLKKKVQSGENACEAKSFPSTAYAGSGGRMLVGLKGDVCLNALKVDPLRAPSCGEVHTKLVAERAKTG